MTSYWVVLILGLLLGIRHAFDADHLVAVSTIVSEYKNPLRAIWVGVSWGLGHTTTLFLAGGALLLMHLQIPERTALWFEFAVAVMLIVLGVQTCITFRRRKLHIHAHVHDKGDVTPHEHFHSHQEAPDHDHTHRSWLHEWGRMVIAGALPGEHLGQDSKRALKPFFRLKSYIVGTVHGLAGSAALMLLVLASIRSTFTGIAYILVFGLGTVVSMGLISIFISIPFVASGRLPKLNRVIRLAAGAFSIIFGLVLAWPIGFASGLLTS